MTAVPACLANGASGVFLFDGYKVKSKSKEVALIRAVQKLKSGEVLRLFIEKVPFLLLRKLVIHFGSKIIFQYLKNQEGLVIIDFKKVRE